VQKKTYPNVDFYSGIILRAMGFPMSMFTGAVRWRARQAGWRTGRSSSANPIRRSVVQGNSTPVRTQRDFVAVDKRK